MPEGAPWDGLAGPWVATPGAGAIRGEQPGLPTLRATVGDLTRLWLGVAPVEQLALVDPVVVDPELLAAFARHHRLPAPQLDWDL